MKAPIEIVWNHLAERPVSRGVSRSLDIVALGVEVADAYSDWLAKPVWETRERLNHLAGLYGKALAARPEVVAVEQRKARAIARRAPRARRSK